ncbi:MAG TPA: VCBS repeat-containing protein [bacterium]|nr:VCBS repeat-containing protein [bacterium]
MNSKLLAVSAFLAGISIASAQSTPPPIPLELRARFGFTGPLVRKVGDGISRLLVGDIDGDGSLRAIVYDGRRARLAVIGVENGATTMSTIATGGQIAEFTLAKLDGSVRDRIVLVDRRGRMTVLGDDDVGRSRPLDLGLGGRGIRLLPGDLDGDGRHDLVALARGRMRIVTDVLGTTKLSEIEPTENIVHSAELLDLDGDGRLDLLFVTEGERMNLRLRRGHGDGTFGPWQIVTIDQLHTIFPLPHADGSTLLATIEGLLRRVTARRYADRGDQAALEWWAFGDQGSNSTPPFAVGDLDDDGDDDLVLFPSGRAQMAVFEWRDGTFVRRNLPTLAGVTSAAVGDVDRDGRLDLLLASSEEEAVAWCPGTALLDRFPQLLKTVARPVAATVAPDGGALVLSRDKRRNASVHRVRPDAEPELLAELGRLPADPARLIAADIGDRAGIELSFVVPGEGLRALTLGGDPEDRQFATAGFTRKMDDGALLLAEHDGTPSLIAVRKRFVRRFRFDAEGQVRVLDQDNGPEGSVELALACDLGDGHWVYFDRQRDQLLRVRAGHPVETIELPKLGFTHLIAHRNAALLLSPRGLLRVPFGAGPSLYVVASHEPPTERTWYWHGASGDFDGDGVQDLAVIDRRLPGVQILAGSADALRRALAVPVFETPPSSSPNNEPRALATGDLDGDGLCDLVLIAHDRVLIYPQDK